MTHVDGSMTPAKYAACGLLFVGAIAAACETTPDSRSPVGEASGEPTTTASASSVATSSSSSPISTATATASANVSTPPVACAESYKAASAGGQCGTVANHPQTPCSYPEGTCSCGVGNYCGGAAPPAPKPTDVVRWSCVPNTPPKRTDGCPDAQPKAGDACTQPNKSCTYGSCCIIPATCEKGKWKIGNPACPP